MAKYNSNLKFNGTSSYVKSDLKCFAGKQTIIGSFYMDDWKLPHISSGGAALVTALERGGIGFELSKPLQVLEFLVYVGGDYTRPSYPLSNISPGWHTFTGVYDLTSSKIYLDGVLVSTQTTSGTFTFNSTTCFMIGANPNAANAPSGEYLLGYAANISIWKKALTAEEVALWHNKILFGDEEDLICYWKLDEGAGNVIKDYSNNGNNGTAVNCTWEGGTLEAEIYRTLVESDGKIYTFDGKSFTEVEKTKSSFLDNSISLNTLVTPASEILIQPNLVEDRTIGRVFKRSFNVNTLGNFTNIYTSIAPYTSDESFLPLFEGIAPSGSYVDGLTINCDDPSALVGKAFDGDLVTSLDLETVSGVPKHLELIFDLPQRLGGFQIASFGASYPEDVKIYGSNDGNYLSDDLLFENTENSEVFYKFDLTKIGYFTHYKIVMSNSTLGNLSIREIKAFEAVEDIFSLILYKDRMYTFDGMDLVLTELVEPVSKQEFESRGILNLLEISPNSLSILEDDFEIVTYILGKGTPRIGVISENLIPYKFLKSPSILTYSEGSNIPSINYRVNKKSMVRHAITPDGANFLVYRNSIWETISYDKILEKGMTHNELISISSDTWGDLVDNMAYKSSFGVVCALYDESPEAEKGLINYYEITFNQNAAPYIIDPVVIPDDIHNEYAILTATLMDYEGDSINYRVYIKKAGEGNFNIVEPTTGWQVVSSGTKIRKAYNFSYFNIGTNTIKILMMDGRGLTREWTADVVLSNATPTIQLTPSKYSLSGVLGDEDGDPIGYRILIKKFGSQEFKQVYPRENFTDLRKSPQTIWYAWNSADMVFGMDNIVKVEVIDSFNTRFSLEFTVKGTYNNLLFLDKTQKRYYIDDRNNILEILDLGTLQAGQTSVPVLVYLENSLPYNVSNVKIWLPESVISEYVNARLSLTEVPFVPSTELVIPTIMSSGQKIPFFVRIDSEIYAQKGNEFKICATGKIVVED